MAAGAVTRRGAVPARAAGSGSRSSSRPLSALLEGGEWVVVAENSVHRDSLIRKGLIWSPRREQLAFTVALFAETPRWSRAPAIARNRTRAGGRLAGIGDASSAPVGNPRRRDRDRHPVRRTRAKPEGETRDSTRALP